MHRILETVDKIVSVDRQLKYGHPLDNHSRTAALWSAYLGIDITAEQVCELNVLQKMSRAKHSVHEDNEVDAIGFMLNKVMVREMRAQRLAVVQPIVTNAPERLKRDRITLVGLEELTRPPSGSLHWEDSTK